MHLTRAQLKEMSRSVHRAAVDEEYQCPEPHLDPLSGHNYRLVAKPKARRAVLEKYGHVCEVVGGALYVRVPLGTHGADNMLIDPATGQLTCGWCEAKGGA